MLSYESGRDAGCEGERIFRTGLKALEHALAIFAVCIIRLLNIFCLLENPTLQSMHALFLDRPLYFTLPKGRTQGGENGKRGIWGYGICQHMV